MLKKLKRLMRPRARLREQRFNRLYRKYRDATMIGPSAFVANLRVADQALRNQQDKTAAIIECGTWRGGMSAALIELGGPDRDYHFFDSFEGLPEPGPMDGTRAARWSKETEPVYLNNNSASLEEFQQTIARANPVIHRTHIHKGWFENTVGAVEAPPIGVLRLDGDWYNSTLVCLINLWDHVIDEGVVLIDDYYAWEGCRLAVHDFIAERKIDAPIYQADDQLAYLVKLVAPPVQRANMGPKQALKMSFMH